MASFAQVLPAPLRLTTPARPLTDGAVVLRPWTEGDVEALVAAIDGDEEISRWLELIPQPYREPQAREWIETAGRGWRWTLEEAGAERVQLRAELENVAAQRVAEKAGFVREGVLRSYRFNPRLGRRMDFVMYSLLPGDAAADSAAAPQRRAE